MSAQALRDLLAPPAAGTGSGARAGIDDLAEALLQRFHLEAQPDASQLSGESLSAEAERALYAWGVLCYEQGRHQDAVALFTALTRRCADSHRLLVALGAAHLACGQAVQAADAFARAHALVPADAEVVFHWAQSLWLNGQTDESRRLLHMTGELARAAVDRWPDLAHWCAELQDRMESASSVQS